jgi:hypothetical protein
VNNNPSVTVGEDGSPNQPSLILHWSQEEVTNDMGHINSGNYTYKFTKMTKYSFGKYVYLATLVTWTSGMKDQANICAYTEKHLLANLTDGWSMTKLGKMWVMPHITHTHTHTQFKKPTFTLTFKKLHSIMANRILKLTVKVHGTCCYLLLTGW